MSEPTTLALVLGVLYEGCVIIGLAVLIVADYWRAHRACRRQEACQPDEFRAH